MTTLLLTHHHLDHVAEAAPVKERSACEVVAHPIEAELLDGVDRTIEPGEKMEVGGLGSIRSTRPGTPPGCSTSWSTASDVFTGDTLFKNSVGGVRTPGSTSFEDLKHSMMEVLMELPHETSMHPGHTDPDHDRRGVGAEPVRAALARARRGGHETCTVGARRPRSCCGRPTTTAATRPGCAGPTAATTSCRAAA